MKFGLSESIYAQIKDVVNKYNKYTFKIFGSRMRGDYKPVSDPREIIQSGFKHGIINNGEEGSTVVLIPYDRKYG